MSGNCDKDRHLRVVRDCDRPVGWRPDPDYVEGDGSKSWILVAYFVLIGVLLVWAAVVLWL